LKHPAINYASPIRFTWKQRLVVRLLPPVIAIALKALAGSARSIVRGEDNLELTVSAHGKALLAVWHEYAGIAAWHFRHTGFHSMASYSFDGELAARILNQFGVKAVRGSSSRGGLEGLAELRTALAHDITVGITLDGPKGPRRVSKHGIATLAAETGIPVIPLAFAVHPAWRMRSWDRFAVPKPFARYAVVFGAPLPPPAAATRDAIERYRVHIQDELNALQQQIEAELASQTPPA
jgi:lysophospholipid acyltransferase (LPLAT)-like uncharacterized protein